MTQTKRYAYLIGANGPEVGGQRLHYAESDALRLAEALRQPPCQFAEVQSIVADRTTDVLSGLREYLGKCEPDDVLLIHFSGHAIFDRRLYLICNQTDLKGLLYSAIRIEDIKEYLSDCRARYKILLLDCCHSGGAINDPFKGMRDIHADLGQALQGSGSVVLAACGQGERARELPGLDGGSGFLSWAIRMACTSDFEQATSGRGSLSMKMVWNWVLHLLKQTNQERASSDQLPDPVYQDTLIGVDSEIWLTDPPPISRETGQSNGQPRLESALAPFLKDLPAAIETRFAGMVRREKELAEIQRHIRTLQPTGGFLLVTGPAGQGKSSILATLVKDVGQARVAHHFILYPPGTQHQMELLQHLIARLILKHRMFESNPDLNSMTYPALRNMFHWLLRSLAERGETELVVIDGLDHLELEPNGDRDLSFLPRDAPRGIVFVLGTRPNDTINALTLKKPHIRYDLPVMNYPDFKSLLQKRGLTLQENFIKRCYMALEGNALYLDLAAHVLASQGAMTPERVIGLVEYDPDSLLSLSIDRLRQPATEWQRVIKPILGVLLGACAPLGIGELSQIIAGVDEDQVSRGLTRLGGFVALDEHRYATFYHPMLRRYLEEGTPGQPSPFSWREKRGYHRRLAHWCEARGLDTLWDHTRDVEEQRRRAYARQHLITHLAAAQTWPRLFALLDEERFGRAKIRRYDRSARSYVRDLDLGRQAAVEAEEAFERALGQFPRVWYYTLLRCSLASQADHYPVSAFGLLILLDSPQEALDLAELVTDPARQVDIFCAMARRARERAIPREKVLAWLRRAVEIVESSEKRMRHEYLELLKALQEVEAWSEAERVCASMSGPERRAGALSDLALALAQLGEKERALALCVEAEGLCWSIPEQQRAEVLIKLTIALAQAGSWTEAERVGTSILDKAQQARALRGLVAVLAQAGLWAEAERVSTGILDKIQQARALGELNMALARTGAWEEAERVSARIADEWQRVGALRELAVVLAQAGERERAQAKWAEVEEVYTSISDEQERAEALKMLATAFTRAGEWSEAERVSTRIANPWQQAKAWRKLARALAQAGEWERAQASWNEAARVYANIPDEEEQVGALSELAQSLTRAGERQRAQTVWNEAEQISKRIADPWQRARVLRELALALEQAGERQHAQMLWSEAEQVGASVPDEEGKMEAAQELREAFLRARMWQEAERLCKASADATTRVDALSRLATALAQANEQERARKLWGEVQQVCASIPDAGQRAETLRELAATLTLAGEREEALPIWSEVEQFYATILDEKEKAESLIWLGVTLARAGERERALALWMQVEQLCAGIPDEQRRAETLGELATVFARAGAWEEAGRICAGIPDEGQQAVAWRELAVALARAGEGEHAQPIWNMMSRYISNFDEGQRAQPWRELAIEEASVGNWLVAESICMSITDDQEQDRALEGLALVFVRAGAWPEVGRISTKIADEKRKCNILMALGLALTRVGEQERAQPIWQEAKLVCKSIPEEGLRMQAWRKMVTAFIQAGELREAEKACAQIFSMEERIKARREMAVALVQAGERERAQPIWIELEEVCANIADAQARATELSALAAAFARAGVWAEAERVCKSILCEEDQGRGWRELALALAGAGKWADAERVCGLIKDEVEQDITIGQLVALSAEKGQPEFTLRLTQKKWLAVKTREDALRALMLARSLFALRPAIGVACYQGFQRVDQFFGQNEE